MPEFARTTSCLTMCSMMFPGVLPAEPIPVGTNPQIFPDDELIAERSGLVRRTHACGKHSERVVVPAFFRFR